MPNGKPQLRGGPDPEPDTHLLQLPQSCMIQPRRQPRQLQRELGCLVPSIWPLASLIVLPSNQNRIHRYIREKHFNQDVLISDPPLRMEKRLP